MERHVVRSLFICSMIGACLAFTIPLSAKEEFRARLLTAGGPTQEKMFIIRIIIDNFTTEDEVRQLQQVLNKSGTSAFLRAFRKTKKGVIRFMGARGLNLRINAAQSRPTENGRKILVFTERQSWDVDTKIRVSGKYRFMVIELDIDKDGKGKGTLYKEANIQMSYKGTIDIESYQTPLMITGVRQRK